MAVRFKAKPAGVRAPMTKDERARGKILSFSFPPTYHRFETETREARAERLLKAVESLEVRRHPIRLLIDSADSETVLGPGRSLFDTLTKLAE